MNYSKDDLIKYNEADYLVLDVIDYKDNMYLYLINADEFENNTAIVKVNNVNGIAKYSHIEEDDEFNFVLSKLFLNHKDDIKMFAFND